MDSKEIIKHVDHTLLAQTATWVSSGELFDAVFVGLFGGDFAG